MMLKYGFIALYILGVLTTSKAVDNNGASLRIIGGENVTGNEYPWIVALRVDEFMVCTGSLIASNLILTAAHCSDFELNGKKINDALLNTDDLTSTDAVNLNLNRDEDQFIIHPNWIKANAENNSKSEFDFMLISLSEHNIDMVKEIDPIKIASEPPIVGESYSVSGYGYIDNKRDLPTTLQITELNIAEDSVCEQAYDGHNSNFLYNPECSFCTAASSATDSCNGDSGGPVFKDGKQYGTVSYGPSICADGITPGAYGKLSVVLDWINEHAQDPTAPPTTATPTTATPTTATPATTPTTATPTTTPTTATPTTPTTPAPRITPTTAQPTTAQPTATPTKSMASSLLLKANLLFTLFLSLSFY